MTDPLLFKTPCSLHRLLLIVSLTPARTERNFKLESLEMRVQRTELTLKSHLFQSHKKEWCQEIMNIDI